MPGLLTVLRPRLQIANWTDLLPVDIVIADKMHASWSHKMRHKLVLNEQTPRAPDLVPLSSWSWCLESPLKHTRFWMSVHEHDLPYVIMCVVSGFIISI